MTRTLLVLAMLSVAAPAWPCVAITWFPSIDHLVHEAEVILRVRAEGLSPSADRPAFGMGNLKQIRFAILETLKGEPPSGSIEFSGVLTDRDDRNQDAVPYEMTRPSGRSGSCYAREYRVGAEYLLMLGRLPQQDPTRVGELTPYWASMRPTTEQLFGGRSDPWFVWVAEQLKRK